VALAYVCVLYVCVCSTEPPVFPVEGFKAERYTIATTTMEAINQKLVMVPVSGNCYYCVLLPPLASKLMYEVTVLLQYAEL
jgi:hypothetical protein